MTPWTMRLFAWRWWLWSAFAAAWTIALVMPQPHESLGVMDWDQQLRYLIGKTIHVLAYATFALLTGWLHVPMRYRWLMLFALMLHAGLTEWIQTFVGRTGMLADVLRNDLGILLGALLGWRWWMAPDR